MDDHPTRKHRPSRDAEAGRIGVRGGADADARRSGARRTGGSGSPSARNDSLITVQCGVPHGFEDAPDPTRAADGGPRTTDRFADRGEIARGGMGTVRRAYDNVLLRQVAMKVMDPSGTNVFDESLRFLEEAQITGQLDHPNIVPVHDLGRSPAGGEPFFTMKLVSGRTLADIFDELHADRLDSRALERVLNVFLKVCDAVSFAHSRGVIHRDLKPDNVMVGTHGQVYLMDWGVALLKTGERPSEESVHLARAGQGNAEEEGTVVGTVAYMAPEQALGRTDRTDERTDVYGLGAILYELLTGKGPNLARTYDETLAVARRCGWEPPERCGAWPELPPGLCEITKRALAIAPADRYQSVEEMKADVEQFLRGGGWFATRLYAAGTVIIGEGDPSEDAYVITKGRCEVYKGSGRQRMSLRQLGPGDVFGETGVFSARARTASVVALDEVSVKVVTRESLDQELDRNAWMRAFVKALAERFLEADEALTRLRERPKR